MDAMEYRHRILGYIEFHVTDKCNLNCNGCSHFSPMVKTPVELYPSFEKDIHRLKELFGRILTIRLLGGEPFLVPNLGDFVNTARSLYPDCALEVVTNGLLIAKAEKKALQSIRDNHVIVNITRYMPTEKVMDSIIPVLKKNGVQYIVSEPVKKFRKRFCPSGNNDPIRSFSDCTIGRRCNILYKGNLCICSAPIAARFVNEYYGMMIDWRDGCLDIHDPEITPDKVMEFLHRPNKICSYCGEIDEENWSMCQDLNNIDLNHWISNDMKHDTYS